MSAYSQLPGLLNLAMRRGDTFSTTVDFDVDLSGHTVTAAVVSPITGATTSTIVTSVAAGTAGVVSLSMSDVQTSAVPVGTHGWRLEWVTPGGYRRTVLSGFVEVTR